jgi:Regulator of chromosome condensation (RCC1) repeat
MGDGGAMTSNRFSFTINRPLLIMAAILVWALAGSSAASAASLPSVDAGGRHSCGVRINASIVCWGHNNEGQATAPAGSFTSVSAGVGHTCAVRTNASIVCWGDDSDGEAPAPAGSFTSVDAGSFHNCALKTNATVVCWGYNASGQATAPAGTFTSVSVGNGHSCGVKSSTSVVCWGVNADGQATAPPGSFRAVSAGMYHSCAVKTNGSVVCWGGNDYGQATVPTGAFGVIAPPPPPPVDVVSFSTPVKSVRVSKTGRFAYSFVATPRRSGTIGFESAKKLKIATKKRYLKVAAKKFTAPASGKVKVRFKLSRSQLNALGRVKKLRFKVTARLAGRTFTRKLTLHAPKKT